tara:strand:- start:12204 stop:12401 length:198 start_codon:yes stop_codon:yes gene_type:complete
MSTSKHTTRCIEKHDFDECFEIASLCICEEAESLLADAAAKQAWLAELFETADMVFKATVTEAKA